MFKLRNIYKKYGSKYVVSGFNYDFSDTGFYLLRGRSGSGKTTILNILAGITDYEGEMFYQGSKQLNHPKVQNPFVSYITQDAYLIEYLTIRENLALVSSNAFRIEEFMKQYAHLSLLDKFPNQISGGEKQRISLIIGLLADANVLLCDEPTSQLDYENKAMFFKLLYEISKDKLVICVTHDRVEFDEVVDVIDLSLFDYNSFKEVQYDEPRCGTKEINVKEKVKLIRSIRKDASKFSSRFMLFLTMIITIFAFMLGTYPKEKMIEKISRDNKINIVTIRVEKGQETETVEKIKETLSAKDVLPYLAYNTTYIESEIDDKDSPTLKENDFSAPYHYYTLPSSKSLFKVITSLEGKFPENENEIILGSEIAKLLFGVSSDQIGQLIDKSIDLPFKDGMKNFVISGVYKAFLDDDMEYLSSQNKEENANLFIFFHSEFAKHFTSENFDSGVFNRCMYVLYYQDTKSLMQDLMLSNNTYFNESNVLQKYQFEIEVFEVVGKIVTGLSFFILVMTILMFTQGQYLNYRYKVRDLSTYHYFGYSIRSIKRSVLFYSLLESVRVLLFAFFVALCLQFLSYILFSLNLLNFPYLMLNVPLLVIGSMFIIATIFMINLGLFLSLKIDKWYQNLIEWRDIL